jgi:predicted metal-dependent phosphoesterase TrpH
MKLDLHCHTQASFDCKTPLEAVYPACAARGLSALAITDHNQIWAALELQKHAPTGLHIIVGEEVYTSQGEIIGLFLQELIPRGLTPEQTLERIKAQGGLALLPHGFDLKPSTLHASARERLAARLDIVEGFNGHAVRPDSNRQASAWAAAKGIPISVGSDAHRAADIGTSCLETPDAQVASPQDLLALLPQGRVVGQHRNALWSFLLERFG